MDEFLLFIYTGNLENSLQETAEELYEVTDKYDLALKTKCSSFFSSNLSVQNLSRLDLMEKQKDNTFRFTWIIENFSMCHQSKGQCLCSPSFVLDSLPGVKWLMQIYPKGDSAENYVAIYLVRDDDVPENCNIRFCIYGRKTNAKSIFSSYYYLKNIFSSKSSWKFSTYLQGNSFLKSLINDIFIIECVMDPVYQTEQELLPELSCGNELFADVELCAGDATYKVHKAILWARWPRLAEKLDSSESHEQIFDIAPNVLEAMVKYVYTGKIDCLRSKILPKLYEAAAKYELPILKCVHVVAQKVKTHINTNKITFECPIQNTSSFPTGTLLYSHEFSVDVLKSCKWNLTCHIPEHSKYARNFYICIRSLGDREHRPIFVRSRICFDVRNSENEHLFQTDETWKCAEFSLPVFPDSKVILLKCEFSFANQDYFSKTAESSFALVSSITCPNFNRDFRNLYKTGTLSDVNIIVGSKTLRVHKSILCARSSVFARMLKTKMSESVRNEVEISDIEADVMDEFLLFIYTGNIKNVLPVTAERLYVAADKYDVSALKEICSSFLKSNLSVNNVCKVLQLASIHSDEDLYKSVFEFSSAHAEEVFSSDEWKNISKDNFWVKLLLDVVIDKKAKK
ncbi:speckle-type POZ protein B-like [Stegodyphus dumicola]|uniref:speckle-type POZ protein B-like n=1 Tax=Stegodyphus dumicola TaxID=202533 RepID=UPI0015B21363|nr:speckle-type POZ protein B-like [Stegodyphus dumicola]